MMASDARKGDGPCGPEAVLFERPTAGKASDAVVGLARDYGKGTVVLLAIWGGANLVDMAVRVISSFP